MSITAIVAVTPDNGIGAGGELLAPNPVDLSFFCGYTLGKVVVVGRKTAQSIGSLLRGRDVVCMSRQPASDVLDVCASVDWVWDWRCIDSLFKYADGRDIVVCGGGEVYTHFKDLYDRVVVSVLTQPTDSAPDTWFDVDLSDYTATEIMQNRRYEMRVVQYDRNR